MEINNIQELIALSKALVFIKFGDDENERRFLASSPYINQLLKEASNALTNDYKKKNPHYKGEWGKIEDKHDYLEQVKKHIKSIDNWEKLSMDTKMSIIKTLCYPFNILDDTAKEIILEIS